MSENGLMKFENVDMGLMSLDQIERVATLMAKSGYFSDAGAAAQAVVKILAGQEMGFGAFASMSGIHIIQGKPTVGANLMAAAVKRSGRYNYRVIEMSETACEIEFYEAGKPCGKSRFTLDDARKAGTKNLDKYARNMLFARAISNGCRWFCPDVFGGAAAYTPEEMGAEVIEAEVMEPARQSQTEAPVEYSTQPPAESVPQRTMNLDEAMTFKNSQGIEYGKIETAQLANMANALRKAITTSTGEELATRKRKLQAVEIILASRQSEEK